MARASSLSARLRIAFAVKYLVLDLQILGRVFAVTEFYCNIAALTPVQRADHKKLTDKLIANSKRIAETVDGYELQYTSQDVSLTELSDWVSSEAKCCPFFDFHIAIRKQGSALSLRLSGEDGIKQFIRAEFGLTQK